VQAVANVPSRSLTVGKDCSGLTNSRDRVLAEVQHHGNLPQAENVYTIPELGRWREAVNQLEAALQIS
jgi:hypothetical protein